MADESAEIEALYKAYGTLSDAGDKAGDLTAEFQVLLDGAHGNGVKAKRLAASLIPTFAAKFPSLGETACEYFLEFCNDADSNVRREAIQHFPAMAKALPQQHNLFADAIAQMLACEDPNESRLVQTVLLALFKSDPMATIPGLIAQCTNADEATRKLCIESLANLTKHNAPLVTGNDALQTLMADELKKALRETTAPAEFKKLFEILRSLPSVKKAEGKQALVDFLVQVSGVSENFDVSNADAVSKFSSCLRQSIPFLKSGATADAFVDVITNKVVPSVSSLDKDSETTTILLRAVADIVSFGSKAAKLTESAAEAAPALYGYLLTLLPEPSDQEDPELHINLVEPVLFSFHKLAGKVDGFFGDEEKLTTLRKRLQFYVPHSQRVFANAKTALMEKSVAPKDAEEKIAQAKRRKDLNITVGATSNIQTLTKDFFHNPPKMKTEVRLSWIPQQQQQKKKREASAPSAASPTKKTKGSGGVYKPPSGKFSKGINAQSETAGNKQGGRGKGRKRRGRGGRGRGSR